MRTLARPRKPEPFPAFYLLTAALVGAAVISAVILDHINNRKGERSYLFGRREVPSAAAPSREALGEVKAPEAPAGTQAGPQPGVEEPRRRAEIEARVVEPPPKTAAPSAAEPLSGGKRKRRPQVALIIDDMGDSLDALNTLIGLKEPVTISILPYSRFARETAEIAHGNGLEVLLHLPLESVNNHDIVAATEGMILASMGEAQILESFESSLRQVPFVKGVNNHMGSRVTADDSLMKMVLGPIRERGLFFVDSRTTAQTVAYEEALKMGIPTVERDVFLDADADRGLIPRRLVELFQKARKNGRAVGIGHPFPETLEALRSNFHLVKTYGLEVVPVSKLVHK
jgi:polysaccharide deacetylase 2 family uncharacterized protein YibQ